MTRLLPEEPRFATEAERVVWERLRDTLPGDALLVANQRLVDERDHEADLVVLLPEVGVVVLEVKGGSVWYDGTEWHQRGGGSRVIHPTEQATRVKYALREYVEADPRWGSRGRIGWAHGVVTPYSSFPADFAAKISEVVVSDLVDDTPAEAPGEKSRKGRKQKGSDGAG